MKKDYQRLALENELLKKKVYHRLNKSQQKAN